MMRRWLDGLGAVLIAECEGLVARVEIRRARDRTGDPIRFSVARPQGVAWWAVYAGETAWAEATVGPYRLEIKAGYPPRRWTSRRHPRAILAEIQGPPEWAFRWEELSEAAVRNDQETCRDAR